jgi:hypothetical protein
VEAGVVKTDMPKAAPASKASRPGRAKEGAFAGGAAVATRHEFLREKSIVECSIENKSVEAIPAGYKLTIDPKASHKFISRVIALDRPIGTADCSDGTPLSSGSFVAAFNQVGPAIC